MYESKKSNPALSNSGILGQKYTPGYYASVESDGITGSIDMIRLRIKLRNDAAFDGLNKALDMLISDPDESAIYTSNRLGAYRYLYVYGDKAHDSTVSVGLALNKPSGKTDATVGFIEFNPNKLGGSGLLNRTLIALGESGAKTELSRYDLAFDVQDVRNNWRLAKDRRKYRCDIQASMTEYLGVRNSPGYVKLYDKSAESALAIPLTRLEMTCAGDWSLLDVVAKWPTAYRCNMADLYGKTSALVMALARLAEYGEPLEPYLKTLDSRTAKKVRDGLATSKMPIPLELMNQLIKQANDWIV